jgi:hypothetical protein
MGAMAEQVLSEAPEAEVTSLKMVQMERPILAEAAEVQALVTQTLTILALAAEAAGITKQSYQIQMPHIRM